MSSSRGGGARTHGERKEHSCSGCISLRECDLQKETNSRGRNDQQTTGTISTSTAGAINFGGGPSMKKTRRWQEHLDATSLGKSTSSYYVHYVPSTAGACRPLRVKRGRCDACIGTRFLALLEDVSRAVQCLLLAACLWMLGDMPYFVTHCFCLLSSLRHGFMHGPAPEIAGFIP